MQVQATAHGMFRNGIRPTALCIAALVLGLAASAMAAWPTSSGAVEIPGKLAFPANTSQVVLNGDGFVIAKGSLADGPTIFTVASATGAATKIFTVPRGYMLTSLTAQDHRVAVVYSQRAKRASRKPGKITPTGHSVAVTVKDDGSDRRVVARAADYSEPKFTCGQILQWLQLNPDGSHLVGTENLGQPSKNRRHRCIPTKTNHVDSESGWGIGRFVKGERVRLMSIWDEGPPPWRSVGIYDGSIAADGSAAAYWDWGRTSLIRVFDFVSGRTTTLRAAIGFNTTITLGNRGLAETTERICANGGDCTLHRVVYPDFHNTELQTALPEAPGGTPFAKFCGNQLMTFDFKSLSVMLDRLDGAGPVEIFKLPQLGIWNGQLVQCSASEALVGYGDVSHPADKAWARFPI
jgi:hypothetical protein